MPTSLEKALQSSPRGLRTGFLDPVRVAVLDSGVDATHEVLRGRVVVARLVDGTLDFGQVSDSGIDANNDNEGHGTAVAGLISAVAPNAEIVDYQLVGQDERELDCSFLAALDNALLAGHPVVNCSCTCAEDVRGEVARRCDEAFASGRVVVAATNNRETTHASIPASLASCIGVSAVETATAGEELGFRTADPIEFRVSPAGVEVARAGGGFFSASGSSFAAPRVSGLCALLLGAFPELTPFEVRTVLKHWSERGEVGLWSG